MEKSFTGSQELLNLEITTEKKTGIHYHEDIELLLVLRGEIRLTVEEESYDMKAGDFTVINANRRHSYESEKDVLAARFVLCYARTCRALGTDQVLFWCSTAGNQNAALDSIRSILDQILNEYVKNSGASRVHKLSLYFELLYQLAGNFLLTRNDLRYQQMMSSENDRKRELFEYIRLHFREDLSLGDVADHLHLTAPYLSRYVRKTCGISFMELVGTVRLQHAVEDLLYTEKPVIRVAMDNGFSNVASFNRAFRETYQMTPSDFRKKMRKPHHAPSEKDQNQEEQYRQQVTRYLEEQPLAPENIRTKESQVSYISIKGSCEMLDRSLTRMLNAGRAITLMDSNLRSQILEIKEQFGIRMIRFWNILDEEMMIDVHHAEHANFRKLFSILDFLTDHDLIPYIDLANKPIRILRTTNDAVTDDQRKDPFSDDAERARFFRILIHELVHRYGRQEVSTWYFEYWKEEDITYRNNDWYYRPMEEKEQLAYFHRFNVIAKACRDVLAEIRIGGGGFSFQHYREEGFANILRTWKKQQELPDFISLNCYPYQIHKEGSSWYEHRNTDMDFLLHNIESASAIMEQENFPVRELHISEYNLTLSNRNLINDHCVKSAWMVQNAVHCFGKVKILGYWLASDIYPEASDSSAPIFGGCGLVTRAGIFKPAAYALRFWNQLFDQVLARGEHYIVTTDGRNAYGILEYNFAGLTYSYYLYKENEISIEELSHLYDRTSSLHLTLRMTQIPDGIYQIRQQVVNERHGSVIRNWMKLSCEENLARDEQAYLRDASIPDMTVGEMKVEGHVMDFGTLLMPNEIRYIRINLKQKLQE